MAEKAHSLVQPEQMGELFSLDLNERYQEIGRGIMRLHNQPEEKWISITPANQVFFFTRKDSITPELTYQGSGLIVSLLLGQRDQEKDKPEQDRRELALFDTEGNFHDRLILHDVIAESKKPDGTAKSHHAIFSSSQNTEEPPREMSIDDIYCISASAKAGPKPREP